MKLKWKYAKPLESKRLIDEYEKIRGYEFPRSFREVVIKNNGGMPNKTAFNTEQGEYDMGYLLSFNLNEEEISIWDIIDIYNSNIAVAAESAARIGDFSEFRALSHIQSRYVIFADTPFGDDIAFDKMDDSVVYINNDTLEIEHIADSFDEFLECLFDEDEE